MKAKKGGRYYTGNEYNAGNQNVTDQELTWIHKGLLVAQIMNNLKATLIVKSMDIKGLKFEKDSVLVLIGEPDGSGTFKVPASPGIEFKSGGKLCVNLDGFINNNDSKNKNVLEKIAFKDNSYNGRFFYYSSTNAEWPDKKIKPKKSEAKNLIDFVTECSGLMPNTEYEFSFLEEKPVLDIDVRY